MIFVMDWGAFLLLGMPFGVLKTFYLLVNNELSIPQIHCCTF